MSCIKKYDFVRRFQKYCTNIPLKQNAPKKVIAELSIFLVTWPFFASKSGFSGITFKGAFCYRGNNIFLKSTQQDGFLVPYMTRFEEKKISHLFTRQSADRKTSYALQLAEKHFTALVIFQNSFLSGLKLFKSILLGSHFHIVP
jgi:hypothetical protein